MVVSDGTRRRRASSSDKPMSLRLTTLRWNSRNASSTSRSLPVLTSSSGASGGLISFISEILRTSHPSMSLAPTSSVVHYQ